LSVGSVTALIPTRIDQLSSPAVRSLDRIDYWRRLNVNSGTTSSGHTV